MDENRITVTSNFSQDIEDIFDVLSIAPTEKAKMLFETWKANPTMFTLAPGYRVLKQDKDGTILKAELIELSIIPKILEKK